MDFIFCKFLVRIWIIFCCEFKLILDFFKVFISNIKFLVCFCLVLLIFCCLYIWFLVKSFIWFLRFSLLCRLLWCLFILKIRVYLCFNFWRFFFLWSNFFLSFFFIDDEFVDFMGLLVLLGWFLLLLGNVVRGYEVDFLIFIFFCVFLIGFFIVICWLLVD